MSDGCETNMRKPDYEVHVFGPPDGHMPMDERLCEEPDDGERVVYHVTPVEVTSRGRVRYICRECGMSTIGDGIAGSA